MKMEDAEKSQRAIVFFLWKEGVNPAEIVRRLAAVFGVRADSKSTVYRWIERFKEGRQSLEDDPRSGRPAISVNREKIQLVENVVMEDRRITVRDISDQCGIGTRQVLEILHDHLELSKISARWVPRLLGPFQKSERMDTCQELLALEQSYGENFWRRIITTDETWIPYYNPETKTQSMEWRRKGEGPPVKAKTAPSIGKVMITVFWDCDGIILIDYLPQGRTINAEYYSDTLKGPLRKAIAEKRPGKLHARPLLQHDNARPHTARLTMDTISELRWELLPHPAYSPDPAPSDFHLFGKLKEPLRGKHYTTLKDLQKDLKKWVEGTPKDFFEKGLKKLVHRWQKCLELQGDYIEKCHIDSDV